MVTVISWLVVATVFCLFGKLCDNKVLMGIGAVMVIMVAMVASC